MEALDLTFGEILKAGGFLGAIGLFLQYLIKRDARNEEAARKREEDTISKLGEVENFQRNQMTGMVTETTKVITQNTVVLGDFVEVVKECKKQGQGE